MCVTMFSISIGVNCSNGENNLTNLISPEKIFCLKDNNHLTRETASSPKTEISQRPVPINPNYFKRDIKNPWEDQKITQSDLLIVVLGASYFMGFP